MTDRGVSQAPASFLESMPTAVRQLIEPLGKTRHFPPGTRLFREGEPHDDIHLVVDGRVRLEMFVRERGRLPLLTVGPGDLLGWSPLLGDHPMTATATALMSVETLAFDGEQLKALCEANHEVGYWLMRQIVQVLSQRLLATRLQLLDLFQTSQTSTAQPVDTEC